MVGLQDWTNQYLYDAYLLQSSTSKRGGSVTKVASSAETDLGGAGVARFSSHP